MATSAGPGMVLVRIDVQNSFGVDTSSTAMGARTTSLLKDLEHRHVCVSLEGNNLELAGNGNPRVAGNSKTL